MAVLSQRIIAKVSGPAWEQMRGQSWRRRRLLFGEQHADG
jgi:hypothetical protein